MSAKPVIPRKRANQDIDEAVLYYVAEADKDVALGFIDALERAFEQIAHHPASGAPRYAHELDLPGLYFHPLKRYPYLVFYREHDDHIDVWRVLHASRDIPAWMAEPQEIS
ncbi:MAG: type II toxin-antitoxin system RelE/ParE family toxin [Rhodospirillales bacterium]|nr:type II toxin-antitoxin system RelE/ParE family toxin [Rhodospirillales bacterium]